MKKLRLKTSPALCAATSRAISFLPACRGNFYLLSGLLKCIELYQKRLLLSFLNNPKINESSDKKMNTKNLLDPNKRTLDQTFSIYVRAMLSLSGLSQRQFAKRHNLTGSYLSRVINYQRKITPAVLQRIAKREGFRIYIQLQAIE
jgi:hypothetical protein